MEAVVLRDINLGCVCVPVDVLMPDNGGVVLFLQKVLRNVPGVRVLVE